MFTLLPRGSRARSLKPEVRSPIVVMTLLMFPEGLFLLAYHL